MSSPVEIEVENDSIVLRFKDGDEWHSVTIPTQNVIVYSTGSGFPAKVIPTSELPDFLARSASSEV